MLPTPSSARQGCNVVPEPCRGHYVPPGLWALASGTVASLTSPHLDEDLEHARNPTKTCLPAYTSWQGQHKATPGALLLEPDGVAKHP
jgi:hypothetical protein